VPLAIAFNLSNLLLVPHLFVGFALLLPTPVSLDDVWCIRVGGHMSWLEVLSPFSLPLQSGSAYFRGEKESEQASNYNDDAKSSEVHL
jgi:hypothetical protein